MNQTDIMLTDADIAIVDIPDTDRADSNDGGQDAIPAHDSTDTDSADKENAQPFLTTLFNHEPHRFDRNEAERLVQLGLYSKPHIDQLRYLAQLGGEKSIKNMLSALVAAKEQQIYDDTASKISDPELARQVAEQRIAKLKGEQGLSDRLPDQMAEDDRDRLNRRLAEEFIELQGEFGDIEQFSQLPDSVKRSAAEQGVALKYAYALHVCREQARMNAADNAQRAAANAAADSFKGDVSDGTSPEMAQVYKALWGN